MMKRRGGARQKMKDNEVWNHHRDPERGLARALRLMEKMDWEQGKGLSDGGGRVGKPWGLLGKMVKREELQESVQLTWQWKWTTPEEAKYWCEAARVDYHEVYLQTFHAKSSQYLFFSSQVAAGGPMHQVQWHCLPFIVTAQLPLTTSFSKGLLIFLASVQRFGEGRYWPEFLKVPARAPAHQLLMFCGWLVKCLTVAFSGGYALTQLLSREGVPRPPPPALRHLPKEGT